jgi:hypothetical protein
MDIAQLVMAMAHDSHRPPESTSNKQQATSNTPRPQLFPVDL